MDSSAPKNTVERTFGMIKPEGLTRHLVEEILRRIRDAGLEVEQKKEVTLTVEQYILLYGHVKQKRPRIYEPMKAYLTSNPCIVLVVKGQNAVAKLLKIRGSSNPADSQPGTIRGDYAKDQDYVRCYDEGKPSLNVFHASDSKAEAERDLRAFFSTQLQTSAKPSGDYFYSPSTGLYVARMPLVFDARTKEAADRIRIRLDWDDEGRICLITFNDARDLLGSLGSRMLTPIEYWLVLADAKAAGDTDMVNQLTSERYAEWLNRVYFRDNTYIDNPQILGAFEFAGEKKKRAAPYGGPGWFNPEDNINPETGEPIHVELCREKYATSWKYWSPDIGLAASPEKTATTPIRGYVTSVGKPSLDLGIPAESRQPKLMIRECRTQPLSPVIDSMIIDKAERLIELKAPQLTMTFIKRHGSLFAASSDSLIYKLREQLFDLLGEFSFHYDVKEAGRILSRAANERQAMISFSDFVMAARQSLEAALEAKRDIVFVMGHKNPDTDAVISTLFEAWRNHLLNGNKTAYIPIVQSTRMPPEVAHLLQGLSKHVVFTNDPVYQTAKMSGLARWISVDQNREPEVQKYFITIIDHHMVSQAAKNRDIPKTLEMGGSSSALVARKMLGMGLDLNQGDAKILYGATLMDTENRVEHKMTPLDTMVMDYLKEKAGISDDNAYYRELMGELLNTDDAEILFKRDYKEDWGFGFAVAKIKGGFSGDGDKHDLILRLYELAVQNTLAKNLPVTLMKITDYKEDNETVNRERVFFAFNPRASTKFQEAVKRAVDSIIRFEFPSDQVEAGSNPGDFIDFTGTGMQLSRKKTAPIIQPIVAAFHRYFFSDSTGVWVKRDFLRYTKEVRDADASLSTDASGRINRITFPEAKRLLEKLGAEMLSMNEYWKVLADAKAIGDIQMVTSLQGSNFVEFWDTAILEHNRLINHPRIVEQQVYGARRSVAVPPGSPGLIRPADIDAATGLPTRVEPPSTYGDPTFWRYWEPDSNLVFPCRSYIFLLDQPSWDGKFHIADSFPNLGLRPVVRAVKEPDIKIAWDEAFLTVEMFEEGEVKVLQWPKKISDYLDVE